VHQAAANSGDLRFDLSLVDSAAPAVVLTDNTLLNARLLSGGAWSALTSAWFHIAHPLGEAGPYLLGGWPAAAPAGSYPASMRFFQTDLPDPGLAAPLDDPWTLPYNLTSRSRINGLGADGIGFVNTGSAQALPGAGFVGAAVLALDTRGTQDIRVTWTGGTVVPNERDQGIRLQYRAGDSGPFLDVTDPLGNPVEYLRNPQAGHAAVIGPATLPAAAENLDLVQLRWKYFHRAGTSGARAQLRLDDIQVTAGPVLAESLAIAAAPAAAQAGFPAAALVVRALGRNGALADGFTGEVGVDLPGLPGALGGTLTRTAAGGVAVFDDLVFQAPGLFAPAVSSPGLAGATVAPPVRVLGVEEIVLPQFIQGRQPLNDLRVPFACYLRLGGLRPLATYRYANQIVNEDDTPEINGAGNMIFTDPSGAAFVRTTASPRFLDGDLGLRHGEFTSDAAGGHAGWFVTEPTGNVRFTPGNNLRVRILLNDGNGGDFTAHSLATAATMRVLGFGSGPGEGSAVFGTSGAPPKSFLVLHEDAAGAGRPLAAVPVEASGALLDESWAPFYRALVAGQAGAWGAIIPNHLPAGVRRFEQRSLADGTAAAVFTAPDGHRPTTGLATGSAPAGTRVPAPGDPAFARWQAARFTLAELADPAAGVPGGDPDRDGRANFLEFAFATNPHAADPGDPMLWLEGSEQGPQLVFRHRRRSDPGHPSYQVRFSTNLAHWHNPADHWPPPLTAVTPHPGSPLETVELRWPVPGDAAFLRLDVAETP
jgi:hypothetical protein